MIASLSELNKKISTCTKCPRLIKSRSKSVLGFGAKDSKIMIIGLAPGKDGADMTGIPFTRDPSGQLINEMLFMAGFSRELDIYITNIVKCNPQDEGGRNRPPSNNEIENCLSYLDYEIKYINPKIIISLGKSASEYFFKKKIKKMKDIHSKDFIWNGKIVFPFIHPGFVIRGAYNKSKYINEFVKISKLYKDILEKEAKLSRFDLLLLILKNTLKINKGEIDGRTRLQKLVFLVQEHLIDIGYDSKYAFRPYIYGPFNRQLYTDIEWLKMNNYVDIRTYSNIDGYISKYILTDKGLDEINKTIQKNNYTKLESDIRSVIKTYEPYSISELVDLVHKEYDEYNMKERKIRNLKLDSFTPEKEI
jgi:DNA polymerase